MRGSNVNGNREVFFNIFLIFKYHCHWMCQNVCVYLADSHCIFMPSFLEVVYKLFFFLI